MSHFHVVEKGEFNKGPDTRSTVLAARIRAAKDCQRKETRLDAKAFLWLNIGQGVEVLSRIFYHILEV